MNFHKLRADSAKECYDIQLELLMNDPNHKDKMFREIEGRWNQYNIDKRTGKPKPFNREKYEGWHITRGSVRQRAIERNRPIKYNRLCVLYVSLFKTSHYRTNVTVENYLAI